MRRLVVGGFTRDTLLGKTPKDKDFLVLDSSTEEMLSLGFKQVGKDFPVFLDQNGDEFALARTERKSSNGYNGFTVETENVTLEDDLSRRDLTINTICLDEETGEFIDPFNGREDLLTRTLKHVSPAFAEDPLRVLRLARFSARYPSFSIHPDTKILASSLKEELKFLTKERVFKELDAVMKTEKPSKFFRTLLELDVLDVVFPELFEMSLIEHNSIYHLEGTVFEHTMRALDECISPLSRFGALFHDLGKIKCFKENGNFLGHDDDESLMDSFKELKENYRIPTDIIDFCLSVAVFHHKFHNFEILNETTIVKMFTNKLFSSRVDEMIEAVNADSKARIIGSEVVALSNNEIDFFFLNKDNGIFEIGKNSVSDKLKKVFFALKNSKIDTNGFMKDWEENKGEKPSVMNIQQFIHNARLSIVRGTLK